MTMNLANDRLGERFHFFEGTPSMKLVIAPAFDCRSSLPVVDVGTCAEGPVAFALNNDNANIAIPAKRIQAGDDIGLHLLVHRVQLLRPVQNDPADGTIFPAIGGLEI